MKSNFLNKVISFFIIVVLFSGCVDSDNFNEPDLQLETYNFIANKTVASLNTETTSSTPKLYVLDDIIEGYVTSSDETGNFYNSISFQSVPSNSLESPIGFSVPLELKSFAKGFTPGRKVYIKLKDLYVAKVDGSLKIGSLFQGAIGRISQFDWNNHLYISSTNINETLLVRTLTLAQAASNANLNTLVEIDNIQFADESLTRTLFDVDSGGGATNHNIVDVNGGANTFLRVSSFSLLSGENVPNGRGKIRGVMTKFGSSFQFIIRYVSDLQLNNSRTYDFLESLNETFESFSTNQKSFKKYINFYELGFKSWVVKSGTNPVNKSIQMSAFGGNIEKVKSYFIIPLNFTSASSLSFDVKAGFYTGGLGLKVYRSFDYKPGSKISDAQLYELTGNFSLPITSTFVDNVSIFVNSGIYNIPVSTQGNGYLIFEYSGNNFTTGPPLTTSIDLDNIVIN